MSRYDVKASRGAGEQVWDCERVVDSIPTPVKGIFNIFNFLRSSVDAKFLNSTRNAPQFDGNWGTNEVC